MSNGLNLKIRRQKGLCTVLEAEIANFSGRAVCDLPGLEFLVPPYPVHAVFRDGKNQQAKVNNVLVFNGAEAHVEEYQNDSGHLMSVVIEQSYLQSLCEPVGIDCKELIFDRCDLEKSTDLAQSLKLLISLNEENVQASRLSLDCFVSGIALTALSRYQHTFSGRLQQSLGSGHYPVAVERMKSVIRDHLLDPAFDLDFLAKESGMSKFQLIRQFRQMTGTSPAKYRMKIKIDLAKQCLLQSRQSILTIATELEFQDLSTFNKAFKKETGLSPTQFRKSI